MNPLKRPRSDLESVQPVGPGVQSQETGHMVVDGDGRFSVSGSDPLSEFWWPHHYKSYKYIYICTTYMYIYIYIYIYVHYVCFLCSIVHIRRSACRNRCDVPVAGWGSLLHEPGSPNSFAGFHLGPKALCQTTGKTLVLGSKALIADNSILTTRSIYVSRTRLLWSWSAAENVDYRMTMQVRGSILHSGSGMLGACFFQQPGP